MKKILFLALHLGYGGAEKAIIAEANILAEKYEVEIACAYKLYEKPAFSVDPRVKITYLSTELRPNKEELKQAIQNKNMVHIIKEGYQSLQVLYYRKAFMKKMIKQSNADIIVSTRYLYHNLLGKNRKQGVVTIAQEHNHHKNNEKYIKKIINSVKGIDYFMPVSKELTDFYSKRMDGTVCVYIPHSLEYIPKNLSNLKEPRLISVGRLSAEKGFSDLIKIFSQISSEFPEWELHIVGDGVEREPIENLIQELKLESKVVMHGFQSKEYINNLLAKSSIYIMTSLEEAFGIVLIEAQSFGIPCVAFDSAKGALEIIEDQKNGYLISNRDRKEMCLKIKKLITDSQLRKELGMQGRENSLKYSVDVIKKNWFEFIESI
ncbi:MAG: glycosyltransferase [Schaedlerella sp.]|nr:glycosyltransferase [Schaedlerella sp.]